MGARQALHGTVESATVVALGVTAEAASAMAAREAAASAEALDTIIGVTSSSGSLFDRASFACPILLQILSGFTIDALNSCPALRLKA